MSKNSQLNIKNQIRFLNGIRSFQLKKVYQQQ